MSIETEPYQPELPFKGLELETAPFVVELPYGNGTTDPIIIESLDAIRSRGPAYAAQYAREIVSQHGNDPTTPRIPSTLTADEAAKYLNMDVATLQAVLPLREGQKRWSTKQVLAYRLDPRTAYAEV